jgi:pyruvate/2-oxoglutarate dehydrogenase complex dihydrolipoamide acyltransferase (E2) component
VIRRMSAALGAALATLALFSACGGDDEDDAGQEVASLGTEAPAAEQPVGTEATDGSAAPAASTPADGSAPPASAPTDPDEAMLAYTECMRDHGIELGDPQPLGGEGEDQTEVQSIEGDPEDIRAAEEDCQPLLEAAESDEVVDPEQEAERREQMLAYAECMREHGIDMPDPVVDDDGRAQMQMPDRVNRQEFQAASAECGGAGI